MSKECEELHKLFSSLKRYSFPFNKKEIPENGIYILFEKGELAHETDRIVRIGTHTGQNQLGSRLKQHFQNPKKDRSIFRKNIGRALLNKNKDTFLKQWELDLTSRKAKETLAEDIDINKQNQIEEQVTKYIQDNFSFAVFPAEEKDKRLEIEAKIISTISSCKECKSSQNWLGFHCPNEKLQSKRVYENCLKIRSSGLWNVNELYKQTLSNEDINKLKELIKNAN